jgi:hypothetical protein
MPTVTFSSSQCGAATIVTLVTLGVLPVAILLLAFFLPGAFLGMCLVSVVHANFLSTGYWSLVAESRVFAAWRSYFSFSLHSDLDFSHTGPTVLAVFPHGLVPLSAFMLSDQFGPLGPVSRIPRHAAVPFVANVLFYVPFLCNLLMWLNCRPVSRLLLPHGEFAPPRGPKVSVMFADGISGMFQSHRDEERVVIRRRKNLIRHAIRSGSLLVPVYCFGHTQLYDVWPGPGSLAERLSRWCKVSFILGWGATWFPWVPRKERLYVAIGEGIQCQPSVDPSQAQVDEVHEQFIKALVDLFNKHRHRADGVRVEGGKLVMDGGWASKELILL